MLLSTATIPGSAHTAPGKPGKINNQDAIAVRTHGETTVVVLTDGCGSQPHSETGADIGANLIANLIMGQIKCDNIIDWLSLPAEICAKLTTVIELVSDSSFDDCLLQRFMFTICVAVIHEGVATVAVFGDGYMIIDDMVIPFESPIPNTPAYIGYLLRTESPYHEGDLRANLKFQIVYNRPVTEIKKSLVLATDGIRDLNLEDIHHPGLLATPIALQCWLASQNIEYVSEDEHKEIIAGPLRDDVTLAIIRTEASQEQLMKSRAEIVKLKMAYNNFLENMNTVYERWRGDKPIKHVRDSQMEEFFTRAHALYEIAEEIDAILDCKEIARIVHEKVSDLKALPVWEPGAGMYGMYGSRGSYYAGYGGGGTFQTPTYHRAHDDDDFMVMTHGAEPISPRSLQDEQPLPLLPAVTDELLAKTNGSWITTINKGKNKSKNKNKKSSRNRK